ncbi:MAG TPA: hypothetical protein PKC16_12935, partial [Thauera aminoaromatica]|nr:hypothetical protein [Thauera aminoaromatica]
RSADLREWVPVGATLEGTGHRQALNDEAPPAVALAAAAAGFDLLTAVLPDDDPKRLSRLHALITAVSDGPAVVAVGGIRKASDVAEVRASGAAGVQVHRAFSESGATCLAQLLGSA